MDLIKYYPITNHLLQEDYHETFSYSNYVYDKYSDMMITDNSYGLTTKKINGILHGPVLIHNSRIEYNRGMIISYKDDTDSYDQDKLVIKMKRYGDEYHRSSDGEGEDIRFDLKDSILTNLHELPEINRVVKGDHVYKIQVGFTFGFLGFNFICIKPDCHVKGCRS